MGGGRGLSQYLALERQGISVCADLAPFAVYVAGLHTWDVSNVVTMASTFQEAEDFDGDISDWKTGRVPPSSALPTQPEAPSVCKFSGRMGVTAWCVSVPLGENSRASALVNHTQASTCRVRDNATPYYLSKRTGATRF